MTSKSYKSLSWDNLEEDRTKHEEIEVKFQDRNSRPFVTNEEIIKEGELIEPFSDQASKPEYDPLHSNDIHFF